LYAPGYICERKTRFLKGISVKLGIIGAGPIGATLAGKLVAAGHEVKIANSKGPRSLAEVAVKTGASAVSSEDAMVDVDAVILSIPFGKVPALAPLFEGIAHDVPVIDTSNYYPYRDGAIADVDDGKAEGVWVSEQLGRPVVKAWNAILARTLIERGLPPGSTSRIAVPVAGDLASSRALALQLVEDTGFAGVDAGGLEESWRQEPGTPAWCTELSAIDLTSALKRAERTRVPKNREVLVAEMIARGATLTHDDIVALNRSATA
jgi:predicted dinucleotide-binding enzyme